MSLEISDSLEIETPIDHGDLPNLDMLGALVGQPRTFPYFVGADDMDLKALSSLMENVASRVELAGVEAPANGELRYLNEGAREGVFKFSTADLSAYVTADTFQGIYVPPASDPDGSSGAWVREGDRLTPGMFGATPYDPNNEVWCHTHLNAFYRMARVLSVARRFEFDASGHWGVADTIIAAYWDPGESHVSRRFVAPTLRVAPLAQLPGGVPLDVAFEIATNGANWIGKIGVHISGTTLYGVSYANRRYKVGVRRRFCGRSTFESIHVDDAIYEGVDDYSWQANFTLDGILFTTANNIGMRTEHVWGRACGSSEQGGTYDTPKVIAAKEHGGAGGVGFSNAETWTLGAGPYGNSSTQRSRLTVNNTTGLRIFDLVWTRLELTPAIFGTVAADNATRKITWSAGDPTTYLNVGDIYPYFTSGPNAFVEFRIVSFGGVSNREIIVDRAPTSHAATADYLQNSAPSFHTVSRVEDATHVIVYPWVPDRNNSTLHVASGGALRVTGQDSANTYYGTVVALGCGYGVHVDALYAPTIGTFLPEYCEMGLRWGPEENSICQGFTVNHGHIEACRWQVMINSSNTTGRLCFPSEHNLSLWGSFTARAGTNSQFETYSKVAAIEIETRGGMLALTNHQLAYEGIPYYATLYGITNAPETRRQFLHDDSGTLPVTVDYNYARLGPYNHWASLKWTGPAGAAPTGTLTLNLDPVLVNAGWTFAGDGAGAAHAITAPAQNVKLEFEYLFSTKKVAITRVDGV